MNILLRTFKYSDTTEMCEILVLTSATCVGNDGQSCPLFHGSLAPMIFSRIKSLSKWRQGNLLLDSNAITWVRSIFFIPDAKNISDSFLPDFQLAKMKKAMAVLSQKRYISVSVTSVTIPCGFLRFEEVQKFLRSCCPRLESIEWENGGSLLPSRLNDDDVAFLSDFTLLKSLCFSNAPITAVGFKHLTKLKSIKKLELTHLQLNDDCLESISCLKSLEDLKAINCESITESGLFHLTKLPLRNLVLRSSSTINDEGMKHIAKLERLESLNLSHIYHKDFTDYGLYHLGELCDLQELNLMGCDKLTDTCLLNIC